jgi:hypothetical protein
MKVPPCLRVAWMSDHIVSTFPVTSVLRMPVQ